MIQEYDCDGMYYDQVHVSGKECGDPSHGHPVGGGNCRIEGVRELYDRVRRESLAKGEKSFLARNTGAKPTSARVTWRFNNTTPPPRAESSSHR